MSHADAAEKDRFRPFSKDGELGSVPGAVFSEEGKSDMAKDGCTREGNFRSGCLERSVSGAVVASSSSSSWPRIKKISGASSIGT